MKGEPWRRHRFEAHGEPAQGLQGLHHRSHRPIHRKKAYLHIDLVSTRLRLVDSVQIALKRNLLRWMCEALVAEPYSVAALPGGTLEYATVP